MKFDIAPPEANRYGFGLTEAEVRRLQRILQEQCNETLTLDEAWARGIELLAFGRMLLESLPPRVSSTPGPIVRTSSPLTS